MAISAEQDLKNWKDRLSISHRKFELVKRDRDVYKRYYQGDQWHDMNINKRFMDRTVDNVIFSNIRAVVPKLNSRNPKIFVEPTKKPYVKDGQLFDTTASAMYLEALLNYWYRVLDVKREARKALYDCLIGHFGLMEIGYTFKTEKVATKGKMKGKLIEVDEMIKEDSIFVKRRSPEDFRRDPESTDHLLHDDRWIAMRWVRSLDDIKANPRYENTKWLKTNFQYDFDCLKAKPEDIDPSINGDPEIWRKVEGWTIWDKKERRRKDLVENHDKWLSNEPYPKWMDNVDGFPIEILYLNENPDEQTPISDIQIYKQSQDEINQIGSMQMSHIRRISERRYLANANAFDDDEERKLANSYDGVVIKTNMDPNSAVVPLKDTGISQDIYMVQRLKKQEISEEAGVSPSERQQTVKFETATEPALLNQNTQFVRGDQRGLFEDFAGRVVRKMSFVIQSTTTNTSIPIDQRQFSEIGDLVASQNPNMAARQQQVMSKLDMIITPDGSQMLNPWFNLSKEDIKGQYNFTIEMGSMAPVNDTQRRNDIMALSELLANSPYIDQEEATRRVLEAFDEKDIERIMKDPEQVQAESEQQMQAQMTAEMEPEVTRKKLDIMKNRETLQSKERIAEGQNQVAIFAAMMKGKKDKETPDKKEKKGKKK